MSDELDKLIERAKALEVSPESREAQRRSFAYGNTHFENEQITRDTVARAAERLAAGAGSDGTKD
jgi:hypothetical protein